MSRERQYLAAAAALGATLLGFAGVADDRLSLLLIVLGFLIAVRLGGPLPRRSARGNR
jgi:hypothetical protein